MNSHVLRMPELSLQQLLDELSKQGYGIIAPTIRDGAIIYDEIRRTDELPIGWSDEQGPGKYRLNRRNDRAYFGYAVGPHAWKKFLHPPMKRLWSAQKTENGFTVKDEQHTAPKMAFLGVRACEIQAIRVQDKVFMNGPYVDPDYAARREGAFIIAINCGQAGGTCFCVSMKTGPKATFGYDLALTEIIGGGEHFFLLETGTERGAALVAPLGLAAASEEDVAKAQAVVDATAKSMGRQLDTSGIKELFYRNYEHPRWDAVAQRCLNCANCTMACPTCFCSTVEDITDLTGEHAERWRKWDSCFTMDFTYVHGGTVRASGKSRYRHWLTHKLATWIDQFGTSGCVGCGRCITWCPVGIDLTEETAAIRAADGAKAGSPQPGSAS